MREMTPQSKSIFDLLQLDQGFKNPLTDPLTNLNNSVTIAVAHMDYLNSLVGVGNEAIRTQLDAAGLTVSYCTAYKNKLNSLSSSSNTLRDHSALSVKEYSQRTQLARTYITVMDAATRSYTGNPYSKVLYVATDKGLSLVNTLKDSIDSTNTKLQALKVNIQGSGNNIPSLGSTAKGGMDSTTTLANNYPSSVTSAISTETALISDYLQTNINGYLAVSLPDWNEDTSKSPTLNIIASSALKALL